MKNRKFVWVVLCALGGDALATDVYISIDGAQATKYELESMQVSSGGVANVQAKTIATGTTYPQIYTLTVSATNGSVVLASDGTSPPGLSYTCLDAATCISPNMDVTLKAKPVSAEYRLKNWGGACAGNAETCAITMTANRTVSAVFELVNAPTPGTGVSCAPGGSTLVDVETPLPTKSFQRTDYANVVTPSSVYAFAFKTKDTAIVSTGQLIATKLSNSIGNKLVVISECRGDISTSNKDAGCALYSAESTNVYYVLNKGAYKPDFYCNLKPNTQYYANVVSPGKITGLSKDNCTSVANCGFSFEAN